MGLTNIVAGLAVRATQVLIVEVPGQWATRVDLEQHMLRRGWRRAWTPADADVLAVCGAPGPELAEVVVRLWEQMPGPRVRSDIVSPEVAGSVLDEAAALLLDTGHHRTDARQRAQTPSIPEEHSRMDHGGHESQVGHAGMDHGGHEGMSGHEDHEGMDHGDANRQGHGDMDNSEQQSHESHEGVDHGGDHAGHQGHGDMGHEGLEGMDHGDHESHDGMDHGGMDHGGHGGMDMAPEGIALAQGGQDRDGLEMDVLHLPLGPVLPFWPAGLVLDCSLQGDVVVDAATSVVDGHDHGPGAGGSKFGLAPAAASRCDGVVALLALAGASDAAARARHGRNALLRGDQAAARDVVGRLRRTVRRSWLLRWSLRGVLRLDQSDLERHGLPVSCRGDAYDRLLFMLDRLRAGVGDIGPVSEEDGVVPWQVVPRLVTGLELATVRLAVASLDPAPIPAGQGIRHA